MNVEHSSVVIADVCALTGISWPSFDGFQPQQGALLLMAMCPRLVSRLNSPSAWRVMACPIRTPTRAGTLATNLPAHQFLLVLYLAYTSTERVPAGSDISSRSRAPQAHSGSPGAAWDVRRGARPADLRCCWTQEEIAPDVGLSQPQLAGVVKNIGFGNLAKSDKAAAEHAVD